MTARKFLSALTALTMISQITASLTAAAASSEIPGADRVVINSVTADTADFTVETDGAYTAYVAVYNTDGVLEGVRLINLTETGEVSFDEIGFSNGQTLKCMVWDENMLPAAAIYTEAAEVTETETPTETATEAAEEGFVVTFETDEHASVTVYDTQDTTTGGTENASEAYARNSATGEVDISGDGQVNFVVVLDEGYVIDTITAEGGYKNLKNVSGTTYRATKITDAVTVTITTKEIVSGGETEGDGVIHLNNTSIDATGVSGAAVSGTTVTLTESAAAYDSAAAAYVYNIEGTLDDGQIVVAASNKTSEFVLNLDNVTVASSAGNALNATTGAVTLANVSGSTSTFTSTYTYTDASTGETDNGAGIYSKNDLTIKGADSSTKIVANSTYGNGIRCKADLEIGTGDIEVTAGNNGIKGDESIKLTKKAGNVTVTAVGDAMKTDAINSDTLKLDTDSTYAPKGTITVNGGTLELTSTGGDGIQADYGFISAYSPSITINSATEGIKVNTAPVDAWYYTDETQNTTATIQGYIQINGGTFNITSAEDGLKAADYVNISGGDITVVSALDGIQSGVDYTDTNGSTAYTNGNINITGGSFDIKAHGGSSGSSTTDSCKGIKAVNAINISGGNYIINSYDDAIHSNYTVAVTGGTYEIASADDGVHADYRLSLGTEGGADDDYTMNISTSYEGLEGSVIEYLSGTTTLYSTDDGVNAAGDYESNGTYHGTAETSTVDLQTAAGPGGNPGGGNHGPVWGDDDTSGYGMLYIKGGKLYLRAQGDGLDSNGSILISGGVVVVAGTTRGGNGVFDKGDTSGSSFSVTGGTLIGYGTTDMQDNPTVSGQGYLSTTANLTAGSTINVQTSGGYIGIVPEYSMSRALLFVTSPDMSSGSVYSGSVSYSDSDKLVGRTVSNVWYGAYKK
ncbi:MAG: carbohydrate-binding domain-containing protein [Clostridia bacterium]|nr:carbohydrate-binding domain-containing protein [Clostridia bacterium]